MNATASRYTSTELGRALPEGGMRGAVALASGQELAQGRHLRHSASIASVRERARGGSYIPGAAGRDQRIDLLRGFAVVAMVVDHIAGPSSRARARVRLASGRCPPVCSRSTPEPLRR